MARIRSPNYPAISLPAAIEKVRAVHKAEAQNKVPRAALATHLGFGSLNGASASMLSALAKYGLIESVGDGEAKVSDLAMRILFPEDAGEKAKALKEASLKPALFAEIKEKWPDRAPSDESLRIHLVRNGFAQGAVDSVIQIYRDTIDMVGSTPVVNNPPPPPPGDREDPSMYDTPNTNNVDRRPPPPAPPPTPGRPFAVTFDGASLTGSFAIQDPKDIDRLINVLKAQKVAFDSVDAS